MAVFVVSMAPSAHPVLTDAPSIALLGAGDGSLEEVASAPTLGWAHLSPAFVDAAVGEGISVSSRTDGSGRTTTSSSRSVCRALVSRPGAPASFVVCADDVAALPSPAGAGVIEGRVRSAFTPNDRAIEALRAQGVVVSPGARVVTPTGPLQQTLALGALAYVLLVLLGSAFAAAIAVRAALVRDAPAER